MTPDRGQVIAAFHRAEGRLLDEPITARSLIVEPIGGSELRFAAVSADGSWVLTIPVRKSKKSIPNLGLSLLTAEYGVPYELHRDGEVEVLNVSVIRCTSVDPEVRALYAAFCVALLRDIDPSPDDSQVESQVNQWVSLFWRLQAPARRTVTGLIGELVVLEMVEDLRGWVRAWHTDANDNLDFAFSAPRLSVEVKATSSHQRIHELSLHQSSPTIVEEHYFASTIVELRASGDRLGHVIDGIAGRLGDTVEGRLFWRGLASVCGSSLSEYVDVRFMRQVARESLRFYSSTSIPRLTLDSIPAGVSGVRFRSDFSSAEYLDSSIILKYLSSTD